MLKIQEITVDGDVFRLREPRVKDFLRAKNKSEEDFVVAMLAGMLLDEEGRELGQDAVENLPMRVLSELSHKVGEMSQAPADPLPTASASSTG